MAIQSAVVKYGATWAPTGGTDLTFVTDGRPVPNGMSYVVSGDTNLLLRRELKVRATLPASATSANGYDTLQRNYLMFRVPFLSAAGKQHIQTVRIETALHAEESAKTSIISLVSAFAADADFADFWAKCLVV